MSKVIAIRWEMRLKWVRFVCETPRRHRLCSVPHGRAGRGIWVKSPPLRAARRCPGHQAGMGGSGDGPEGLQALPGPGVRVGLGLGLGWVWGWVWVE